MERGEGPAGSSGWVEQKEAIDKRVETFERKGWNGRRGGNLGFEWLREGLGR